MSGAPLFFSNSGGADHSRIAHSVAMDGRSQSSRYFTRTFGSPSSTKNGTWSWWEKTGWNSHQDGTYHCILYQNNEMWRTAASNVSDVYTESYFYSGSVANGWSNWCNVRDYSGWRHVMIVYNMTASSNDDRIKMYFNGVYTPRKNGSTNQNDNMSFGAASTHYIGRQATDTNNGYCGLLAEFCYVDGQSLTPDVFGEYVGNVWVPKASINPGSWGNNGFHLRFDDRTNLGLDSSGRGNHWTPNGFDNSDTDNSRSDWVSSSSGLSSTSDAQSLFTGAPNVRIFNDGNNKGSITFSPGIPYTSEVAVLGGEPSSYDLAAINGNSSGTYIYSNNEQPNWNVIATGSGTLNSVQFWDARMGGNSCTMGPIRVDGKVLVNAGGDYMANWSTDTPTSNLGTYDVGHATGDNDYDYGITDQSWGDNAASGQMGVHSSQGGKWFFEVVKTNNQDGNSKQTVGFINSSINGVSESYARGDAAGTWCYRTSGQKCHNASDSSYGPNVGSQWVRIGVKLDLDNRTIGFIVNGTDYGTAYSGLPDGFYVPEISGEGGNVGQAYIRRPPTNHVPSGYKVLEHANLPAPECTEPWKYFNVQQYTGNGSSKTITTGFQPDLVWLKGLDNQSDGHWWFDSVRGIHKMLKSNSNESEATHTNGVTWFGDDYFSIGNNGAINSNGQRFVAYSFRKKAGFFDIVTFTGNGSNNRDISHSLGKTPSFMVIMNRTSSGYDSYAWHKYQDNPNGQTWLRFNSSNAQESGSGNGPWTADGTPPCNSSTFTVSNEGNRNGDNYVVYLWTDCAGLFETGQYRGNGWPNGPVCRTSFRPDFLWIKRRDTTASWVMYDTARDVGNLRQSVFQSNDAQWNQTVGNIGFDFQATGFKYAGGNGGAGDRNGNNGHFLWMCWGMTPMGSKTTYPPNAY